MGNKTKPALTICLLLMAALSLEASVRKWVRSAVSPRNWALARQYCLTYHVDLVSGSMMQEGWPKWWKYDYSKFWIGLKRSPDNDSVWMDVNIKTGEGISGGDLSQSNQWAYSGESSSLCATVDERTEWRSRKCSNLNHNYCSIDGNIQYSEADLNWFKASEFCQLKHGFLTTVTENNKDEIKYRGWIGLYRRGGDTWSWIGGLQSNYSKWASGEPSKKDCAMYDYDTDKWYSRSCSQEFQFLCFADNLVLVNENKTWEEALEHCRSMPDPCAASRNCVYNLLSLKWSDHSYVRDRIDKATSDEVWIGLRFLGGKWWWENKEELEDSGGLPKCPSQQQHCGTLSKHDTKRWSIRDCSEKRNFVCDWYAT